MRSVLFTIGSVSIYSYGFMVALGFMISVFLMYRSAQRSGFDPNKIVDIAICMLVSGIIGARILFIALNTSYYMENPLEVFDLSKGGLVWYGGFIAAFITLVFYVRVRKMSFGDIVDIFAPYIALGQAFGRIGCFLNGCCYGVVVQAGTFCAVAYPHETVARIPVQVISSMLLVVIFVILRKWQDRPHFKGEIFIGYCLLYAIKRFAVEYMRGDNPKLYIGLTMSQCLSVVIGITALSVLMWKRVYAKK